MTYNFDALYAKVFPQQSENARRNNPTATPRQVEQWLSSNLKRDRFPRSHANAEHWLFNAGLVVPAPTTHKVKHGRYAQVWRKLGPDAARFYRDLRARNCTAIIPYGYDQKRDPLRHWVLEQLYAEHDAEVMDRQYAGAFV